MAERDHIHIDLCIPDPLSGAGFGLCGKRNGQHHSGHRGFWEDAWQPAGKIMRDLYLPMLKGSLWTGALLVFVDVMKELPATLMLQPVNVSTLATRAFAYAAEEMLKQAAPWCVAIVLTGLLPVILLNRKLRSSAVP